MKRILVIASILAVVSSIALAQQQTKDGWVMINPAPGAGARVMLDRNSGPLEQTVIVNGTDFLVDGKSVKGAPYSAESITETVQMLADGNRITHNSSTKIYRDSEGRTRRELGSGAEGLAVIQMRLGGLPLKTSHPEIFISDPVAGVNYSLDPEARTARKLPAARVFTVNTQLQPSQAGETSVIDLRAKLADIEKTQAAAGVVKGEPLTQSFVVTREPANNGEVSTESLGTRNIEGVEAEGKRVSTTIPAGQIGNDLPIVLTNETWFSPKLQTLVLSKRHDPRFGDTTYRLTNISLSEPAASLFQVPSDYTIMDAKSLIEQRLMRQPRDRDRFE